MTTRNLLLGLATLSVSVVALFLYLRPGGSETSSPGREINAAASAITGASQTGIGTQSSPSAERSEAVADERRVQTAAEATAGPAGTAPSGRKKSPFADPAMRKVMESEAKAGVARSVEALFKAGLAAELQLSETESEALRKLLLDRDSIVWQQIMLPMAAGELNGPEMDRAGRSVKQSLELSSAELRGLLGDDGFAKYERFAKMQPDRETVKRFAPECAQAGLDLTKEQETQLLTIITDERAKFPFEHDIGDPMQIDYARFHETFSEENTNLHFAEVQRFNARLLDAAQRSLTPEQTGVLGKYLATQLQRAKFTVATTRAITGENR